MPQHLPLVLVLLAGLLLSAYAYTVEQRSERARRLGVGYRAYCDIGPFSCTRIFSSEFGSVAQRLFGLPPVSNAAVGMAFYASEAALAALAGVSSRPANAAVWCALLLLSTGASVVASVGLAYILTVILHDLCVVCCSIYVVNVVSCILTYRWFVRTRRAAATQKPKSH